jgi:putative ABC transport system permease protein
MGTFRQDLRVAWRTLRGSPSFALVAGATLALGLGANVTLFSMVHAILLRALPYPAADRLMVARTSIPDFDDLVARSRSFEDTACWASNRYDVRFGSDAEPILGAVVTRRFFPLLGAAALGRTFLPEEDGQTLAVISHSLWQRRYAGSPDVLGTAIELADRPYTIVGVMPPAFEYPDRRFEAWSTMGSAMSRNPAQLRNRALRIFGVVLLRKAGVPEATARAEAAAISTALAKEHPDTNAGVSMELQPLADRVLGGMRRPLLILLGAVGLTLLIACANVAHLVLARATARGREMAVRRALGASEVRIARQLVTEGLVLAALGGAAGVLLAGWSTHLLRALAPVGLPRVNSVRIDANVLVFAGVLSTATTLLFALAPLLVSSGRKAMDALRDGSRGTRIAGRGFRQGLVVAELALSLVVLVGAGLLLRSFHRLVTVDPGFVADDLVTMGVGLWRYDDPEQRTRVLEEVLDRLRAVPGVAAVGSGTGLPPETAQRGTSFDVRERPVPEPGAQTAYFIAVTADYFRALGAPMIEGRPIDRRDAKDAAKVVMINGTLARRLFGAEPAVGKHVRLLNPDESTEWREVVGVVADVRFSGLDDPAEAAIYTPFAQTPFPFSFPVVRTRMDPLAAAQSIRRVLGEVDPRLASARIAPMSELVAGSVSERRFSMLLLSGFAALALALAAVGTYGVIAYDVALRTREIGVRLALGAPPRRVVAGVVRQGLRLVGLGAVLGLCGAWAATRVLGDLLYELSPKDPVTFAAGALLLAAVAVAASYIPARRAARVDPAVALRAE